MSDEVSAISFNAPSPETLAPLFSGYEIQRLIAQGGMGAVYLAHQIALDRPVALKILPKEMSSDESFRTGFTAEAQLMAKLNHPNLIAIYDFGQVEGMLFIIMEYVEGQSLHQALHTVEISHRETARIVGEVAEGVAHAHRYGIIHRDIKPANVLLDQQLRPKMGDFGLARPVGALNPDEVIYGTPAYTAPEVINSPERVDVRADVFSLGRVLYESLTGQVPTGNDPLASAVSGCSPAFDAIIQKATNQNPSLRYADIGLMAKDLERLAKSGIQRPVTKSGPGTKRIAPPLVRVAHGKRGRVVIQKKSHTAELLGLIVVILVGGGVFWYFQVYQKEKALRSMPQQSDNNNVKSSAVDPNRPVVPQRIQRDADGNPVDLPGNPSRDPVVPARNNGSSPPSQRNPFGDKTPLE